MTEPREIEWLMVSKQELQLLKDIATQTEADELYECIVERQPHRSRPLQAPPKIQMCFGSIELSFEACRICELKAECIQKTEYLKKNQKPTAGAVLDLLEDWSKDDEIFTEKMITRSNVWWHRRFREALDTARKSQQGGGE